MNIDKILSDSYLKNHIKKLLIWFPFIIGIILCSVLFVSVFKITIILDDFSILIATISIIIGLTAAIAALFTGWQTKKSIISSLVTSVNGFFT